MPPDPAYCLPVSSFDRGKTTGIEFCPDVAQNLARIVCDSHDNLLARELKREKSRFKSGCALSRREKRRNVKRFSNCFQNMPFGVGACLYMETCGTRFLWVVWVMAFSRFTTDCH
jgi:hypothetical protein